MNRLLFAGFARILAGTAGAQATHHAEIFMVGPSEVMRNSTYTLEVWGRFDSPWFVEGTSAIAGFGIGMGATTGFEQLASISNVQIAPWAGGFGWPGIILGLAIVDGGVSGGQLANLFGFLNPNINMSNPILLYTVDFTTGDVPITHIGFAPQDPNVNGGLSFYPISTDGASIIAPNHPDSSLTLTGWEYFVPSPGAGVLALAGPMVFRRRR